MTVDGESFEQLAPAEEESLNSREQQALAETSRTAKEIILTLADKFVNVFRLVDIKVIPGDNLRKTLNSYRVLSPCRHIEVV